MEIRSDQIRSDQITCVPYPHPIYALHLRTTRTYRVFAEGVHESSGTVQVHFHLHLTGSQVRMRSYPLHSHDIAAVAAVIGVGVCIGAMSS